MPELTQAKLKELLHYNPKTGVFIWIRPTNWSIKVGIPAGSIKKQDGYRRISIYKKSYKASRLAWLYMDGVIPKNIEIDHKDRIRSNDKWSNLRLASSQCNARNRGMLKRNTSGITGVYWYKPLKKWLARIGVNRKSFHIGYSESKKEAALLRWHAEKKYNFPNCNSTSSAFLYLKERGVI